jgi:hypothetical protein
MSTKKSPVKKSAKKPAAKKVVKKPVAKAASTTGNRELDKMLTKITKAKAKGESSVVVLTTNPKHYNLSAATAQGFGAQDLKPKFYEAYKHLLCNYNLVVKPIGATAKEMAIEWSVPVK